MDQPDDDDGADEDHVDETRVRRTGGADGTRRALIDAGWTLLDGITVGEALRSLTAADIAAEAGRSERTFWNHFEDWSHYTAELLADIPRRGPMEPDEEYDAVAAVDDALAGSSRAALPDLVRIAALANWQEVTRDEELAMLRRQLFLVSRTGAQPEVAGVLGADYYGRYIPMLRAIYESTGAETGVAPALPLDWEAFTRVLAALSEGLEMQSVADPDTVTADLAVEATSAVALALLTPTESREVLAERAAAFGGPGHELVEDAGLVDLARVCRPIIEERGGLDQWGPVAEVTGVPVLELRNRAQRLSVLEALAFEGHRPFDSGDHPHGSDATSRAFEGLCRLARSAQCDSRCASSLLAERLRPGGDAVVVRSLVPIGAGLAETLGEQLRSHHERVVDMALAWALSAGSVAPAQVAAGALGAHPGLDLGG